MDTVKVSFVFEDVGADFHPPHLARILLDAQYLLMACLVMSGELRPDAGVFTDSRGQRYKRLIEADSEGPGESEITVSRITMESPLSLDLLVKVRDGAKKVFAGAVHISLIDLKRRELEASIRRQELEAIAKEIENAASTRKLAEELPEHHKKKICNVVAHALITLYTEPPRLKHVDQFVQDENGVWVLLKLPPPPTPKRPVTSKSTSPTPPAGTNTPPPTPPVKPAEPVVRQFPFEKLLARFLIIVLIGVGVVMVFMFSGWLISIFR
jgi:hypothetical protein